MLRDVPLAEDLTQEALLAALDTGRRPAFPKSGRLADGDRTSAGAGSSAPWPDARRSTRSSPATGAGAAGIGFRSALDDDIATSCSADLTACHPCCHARPPRTGAAHDLRA